MNADAEFESSRQDVLIAEDSPTQAEVLRKTLEQAGYSARIGRSGVEALKLARQRKPTLVISDVLMPEMNGYELCKALKSDPALKNVPFVLLSVLSDPKDIIYGLDAGADNYVTKPFESRFLLSRISSLLNTSINEADETHAQGLRVTLAGNTYVVKSGRRQALNLLVSTFETAVEKIRELSRVNAKLAVARDRLRQTNSKLEEELSKRFCAESEAREAVRQRDHFLAMLSHELRNPLGAILNATYVLDRAEADAAAIELAHNIVHRQAQQMSRLLGDLLDVSRITNGKIHLDKEVFDSTSALAEAVEVVRPQIDVRQQQLHVKIASQPLYIHADRARLQQVFVNLLTNAVKYTPRAGDIWIEVSCDEKEVVFCVRDSGEGISQKMIERIFGLFVQSERTLDRSDAGLGVGLTLVRSLVKMHGGQVTAHSEGEGTGSEFVVRLPRSSAPRRPTVAEHLPASHGVACKVVIVEDNQDSREMLQSLLELDGFEVSTASDGSQGLKLIVSQRPDVALVDIGLPGMDGYEIARETRKLVAREQTYLVSVGKLPLGSFGVGFFGVDRSMNCG